ncbi:substrate-binding periplasmic protein [Neptuniibacter caesariensis]|uniref:Solute-binding protein family 3/N-terminal domain-containing protein n=1 Tax=Neptuniibacter caesariensis TaxID=207954 RepID=A0A7U8C5Q1_NEPCE|nr:transporter substrate-binding domain-containing protein [Neptuniibacter caesariensis]EAR62055.1 hypothetical protein MED92_10129 [Oceanospirillum sp. MED92] [Neptuniibacter caesariensis]
MFGLSPIIRRYFLATCLAISFAASITAQAKPIEVIIYTDNSYPPYSFEEDGKAQGIYADIIRTASMQLDDYKINLKTIPWKRGLLMLEQGKAFALLPPYKHPSKRPYIFPYSVPILEETVSVYCRDTIADKKQFNRWPNDYYGLVMGRNAGFMLGGDAYQKAVEDAEIWERTAKGNRENVLGLGMGRIDCYINDRISIKYAYRELKSEGKLKPAHEGIQETFTISLQNGHIGYTNKDQGEFYFKEDFIEQLDKQIIQMKQDGSIEKIIKRYTEPENDSVILR